MHVTLEAYTQPVNCTIEDFTAYVARIGKEKEHPQRLIKYLRKSAHWSPFEHTHVTFKIVTSRAIGRQLLRHRSFTFQEHSQRYEEAVAFESVELRRQAESNRQSSTEVFDPSVDMYRCAIGTIPQPASWVINQHLEQVQRLYKELLDAGVARECARMILPECTQTTILMTGNLRSWIHMLALREDAHAQKEAQEVGRAIRPHLQRLFPYIFDTVEGL